MPRVRCSPSISMMGLAEIFAAIGKALGIVQQKDAQANTPEMIAAKQRADEAKQADAIKKSVAEKDVDGTRSDLSDE